MKMVVIEESKTDIIEVSKCNNEAVYIAVNKKEPYVFAILIARGYEKDFKLYPLYASITFGNAYGDGCVRNDIPSAIQYYMSSWDFYQFPDFRSAMEYYLEQSK